MFCFRDCVSQAKKWTYDATSSGGRYAFFRRDSSKRRRTRPTLKPPNGWDSKKSPQLGGDSLRELVTLAPIGGDTVAGQDALNAA